MSGDDRGSYVGIVLVALIAGSLFALDTFGVSREPFQLVENRYPQTFTQIFSGEQKAFTLGGILREEAETLTFRFSYLVWSRVPVGTAEDPNATGAYMTEIAPLLALSDMWDQPPEVITTGAMIEDEEAEVVVYDFTRLLNATGDLETHNETLTTYAIAYDDEGAVKGYYKGVSGFDFENRTGARIVHLSLNVDDDKQEFYESGMASAYETPSLSEAPKLGTVDFPNPRKGSSYRVTYTLEATQELDRSTLQIARVYKDAELQVCLVNEIESEEPESGE